MDLDRIHNTIDVLVAQERRHGLIQLGLWCRTMVIAPVLPGQVNVDVGSENQDGDRDPVVLAPPPTQEMSAAGNQFQKVHGITCVLNPESLPQHHTTRVPEYFENTFKMFRTTP